MTAPLIYPSWDAVPPHLMSATGVRELEFPRDPSQQPIAAYVEGYDHRDRPDTITLYDALTCPPTTASARQLEAAAQRQGAAAARICVDCGGHAERPIRRSGVADRRLCPACLYIARLRSVQAYHAAVRRALPASAAAVLGWDAAAVVQVDFTIPPPTPAGAKRKPTAMHVRAVDLDGGPLLDVLMRLVGPRAQFIPDGAQAPDAATQAIHQELLGRRLILWDYAMLTALQEHAPHRGWPGGHYERLVAFAGDHGADFRPGAWERYRAAVLVHLAASWRGQLNPRTRALLPCVPPGTPDRVLLLLRRIAAAAPAVADVGDEHPGGASASDVDEPDAGGDRR